MITTPAACLEALGGLKEEDPVAIVERIREGSGMPLRTAWHPLLPPIYDLDPWRLVLPQSSTALLAVLGRHVGLHPPAVGCPRWERSKWGWRMSTHPPPGQYPGGAPSMSSFSRVFVGEVSDEDRRWLDQQAERRGHEGLYVHVPAIWYVKDPGRALGHTVAWFARIARAKSLCPPGEWSTPTLEGLDRAEELLGLPRWGVQ